MGKTLDFLTGMAQRACNRLLEPQTRIEHFDKHALISVERERAKSGSRWLEKGTRCGPNKVHASISRSDGSFEDLGISENLLTNIGRDWWAQAWGFIGGGVTTASPATAVTSTSLTATSTPFTASNLATPQLGVCGLRVYAPVTGVTTAPVYGNIISNTT
jgi:hypothetical protein